MSGLGQVATFRCSRAPSVRSSLAIMSPSSAVRTGSSSPIALWKALGGNRSRGSCGAFGLAKRGRLWIVPDVRQRTGVHTHAGKPRRRVSITKASPTRAVALALASRTLASRHFASGRIRHPARRRPRGRANETCRSSHFWLPGPSSWILDSSIVTTALPRMTESMRVGAVDLNVGVSTIPSRSPCSIYRAPGSWKGRRARSSLSDPAVHAGSIACGFANTPAVFDAARAVSRGRGSSDVPVGRMVVLRTAAKTDLIRASRS